MNIRSDNGVDSVYKVAEELATVAEMSSDLEIILKTSRATSSSISYSCFTSCGSVLSGWACTTGIGGRGVSSSDFENGRGVLSS